MSDYAGVVIFGGPMSANDCGTLAGIKCELDWIPKVVEAGVPFLGLCLGAQLLTRAVGGRVGAASRGHGRDRLCRRRADRGRPRLVQGADEGLPVASRGHDASRTAASCWPPTTRYPVQAFRCGANAFGFQFHPEVTLEMKQIWTLKAAERLKMPGAQQRGVHLSMHALYDPPLDRWINGFLDRWLATDSVDAAAPPKLRATPEFAAAAD